MSDILEIIANLSSLGAKISENLIMKYSSQSNSVNSDYRRELELLQVHLTSVAHIASRKENSESKDPNRLALVKMIDKSGLLNVCVSLCLLESSEVRGIHELADRINVETLKEINHEFDDYISGR